MYINRPPIGTDGSRTPAPGITLHAFSFETMENPGKAGMMPWHDVTGLWKTPNRIIMAQRP